MYEAKRLAKNLNILGMHEGREYTYLKNPQFLAYELSRNQMLDLNLGHSYLMDKRYPGFQVLGKDNKLDYKIVVLGGSTTDGGIYEFKSWVDFLYEKCADNNVTIFNGGIAAYTSTQELIKILRDGLCLNPNMIIVYDGINDAKANYKYNPYSIPYLEDVFAAAVGQQSLELSCNISNKDIRESFDIWYDTIKQMYLLAQGKGIRFFSFLQPNLFSKKESSLTLREKTTIRVKTIVDGQYVSDARNYRKLARDRRIEEKNRYMFDLSDIFDECNVYIDDCHVFEEGNQIIADKIWEKVKGDIIAANKNR